MNAGENLKDLNAFVLVAGEGSFTRAAARLGVSQSALSQTIRGLEARLGLRLLARTTRSVAPTEAGERLLALVAPALREIDEGLVRLTELRERPAGTVRISADEFAVQHVLWPALARFLTDYPDIHVELTTDYGLTDIVSERYDAGVRRGRLVSQDMIAVPIGPDIGMAVVGAPAWFARHPRPRAPQDLTAQSCINLRLPTHGGFFAWTFCKGGRKQRVRVQGQLVFNSLSVVLEAALAGFGLAYVPQALVAPHLDAGRLVEVLADWRQTFEGYHLYYPNRRHASPAFALLVEALRYRG
ncbi:LysR family transcriptional regulator [Ruixingdingia sedimenti]|uniref:LysR family transcriptional regulator n=1 Tax=Ruixingdingia sedimenti TaxID=3073604 RepID=A0ABU1FEY6_9RHOB|nr:LysR family transcriptional regulator [Xinfangfangia sp. LG-4]MDR5655133.1 LysR family transcriptional regulator [Xinfangfangia sp. LG-4]